MEVPRKESIITRSDFRIFPVPLLFLLIIDVLFSVGYTMLRSRPFVGGLGICVVVSYRLILVLPVLADRILSLRAIVFPSGI
jgi:hypothetical protein